MKVHKQTNYRYTVCGAKITLTVRSEFSWKYVTCLRCLATIAHVDCGCEKCVKGGWKR
jgi:hypothetical protein